MQVGWGVSNVYLKSHTQLMLCFATCTCNCDYDIMGLVGCGGVGRGKFTLHPQLMVR